MLPDMMSGDRCRAGVLTAWLFLCCGFPLAGAINRPFPQSGNYLGYGLRPPNLTQGQLNAAVSNYYGGWKTHYLARLRHMWRGLQGKLRRDGQQLFDAVLQDGMSLSG
jgi:hypothetical protein